MLYLTCEDEDSYMYPCSHEVYMGPDLMQLCSEDYVGSEYSLSNLRQVL